MTRASDAQLRYIGTLITERVVDPDTVADIRKRSGYLTRAQASGIIQHLQNQPKRSE